MASLCGFSTPFRSTTTRQRGMHEPIHTQGAAHLPVLRVVDGLVGRLPQLSDQDCHQQGFPRLRRVGRS